MVEIEGLEVTFKDNHVLRGVNLSIEAGETVTVIGGSGSGKSVLLKSLIGLITPDKGRVTVKGKELYKLNWKESMTERRNFSMLFQGGALFDSLNVYENIAFPARLHTDWKEEKIRNMVRERLSMVGLPGIEHKKPSELSGGMQKRVALARAIALSPELLLYDEPTTGLDPIMADVINELILKLQRQLNVTSVVVTHDMQSAYKVSDRIVMLYDGTIIADTTPEDISDTESPFVKQFITGSAYGPIQVG